MVHGDCCDLSGEKKGISANQVARTIGVSVKSTWYLCHRIREAKGGDGSLLQGVLELDETFVGGRVKGKGVWYGKKEKAVVLGLKQRNGQVRFVHAPNTKGDTWKAAIKTHVNMPKVAHIMSDDSSSVA